MTAAEAVGEGQQGSKEIGAREEGVAGDDAFSGLRQTRLRAGEADWSSAATSEGVAGVTGATGPEEPEKEGEGPGEAGAEAEADAGAEAEAGTVGVEGAEALSSSRPRFFLAALLPLLPPRLRRALSAAVRSSSCLSAARFLPALARGVRELATLGTARAGTKEATAAEGAVQVFCCC